MTRRLNVQTPGDAPHNLDTETDPNTKGGDTTLDSVGTGDPDGAPEMSAEDMARKIRELEAENLKLKGDAAVSEQAQKDLESSIAADERASASITRQDREKFRNMRANQVNPKTLVAAVLTRDGWVAPDQSGQKPKV